MIKTENTNIENINIDEEKKNISITQVLENILKITEIYNPQIKQKSITDSKNTNKKTVTNYANSNTKIEHEFKKLIPEGNKPNKIVIILADGLGAKLIKEKQSYIPFLRKQNVQIIKTCIPSTTVSAITALTTGKHPSQTQMLGWSIINPNNNKLLKLLTFEGYEQDPAKFQKEKTWFEKLKEKNITSYYVGLEKYRNTGFTLASFKGSEFISVKNEEEYINEITKLNRKEAKLIYTHWKEIDHLTHKLGTNNYDIELAIESFDKFVQTLYQKLSKNTLLVVIADHGSINIDEKNKIFIDEFKNYNEINQIAGEGRSLHIHLKENTNKKLFTQNLEKFLNNKAYILTKENPKINGEKIFETAAWQILGDIVVFPKDKYLLCDRNRHSHSMINMKGVHGSITDDEILIPYISIVK